MGTCKYKTWSRGEDEALLNILGGDEVARAILRGEKRVIIKDPDLLKRVGSVTVRSVQRFVAAEHLKEANIRWMGDNFKLLFLNKVEENIPEVNLVASRLEWASLDAPILAKLGEKAEVSLSYLFDLLKKQVNDKNGILLTNGYANIFYIRDAYGIFWAVSARRSSRNHDWDVEAASIECPCKWNSGRQVFSRDS